MEDNNRKRKRIDYYDYDDAVIESVNKRRSAQVVAVKLNSCSETSTSTSTMQRKEEEKQKLLFAEREAYNLILQDTASIGRSLMANINDFDDRCFPCLRKTKRITF